jgi:hypothetical protein
MSTHPPAHSGQSCYYDSRDAVAAIGLLAARDRAFGRRPPKRKIVLCRLCGGFRVRPLRSRPGAARHPTAQSDRTVPTPPTADGPELPAVGAGRTDRQQPNPG